MDPLTPPLPGIDPDYFALGIPALAFFMPLVVGLLTKGRKGWMTTEQSVFHPGVDVQTALNTYVQRFKYEGFTVASVVPDGVVVKAERRQTKDIGGLSMAHASKPYGLELTLVAREGGTEARLKVWIKDWVIVDTGEGKYIDGMIQRLLEADLANEAPPLVSNVSFFSTFVLYYGALTFAGSVIAVDLVLMRNPDPKVAFETLQTVMIHGGITLPLTFYAMFDIARRPAEITGRGRALAGGVLGLLGAAVAGAALAMTK